MYIKHALSKQHAWLAVVMAIAACLFFLPFATKAYADGTFEITDWLSGYGYSSLQYIYSNNKAAMDAASTWSSRDLGWLLAQAALLPFRILPFLLR